MTAAIYARKSTEQVEGFGARSEPLPICQGEQSARTARAQRPVGWGIAARSLNC
jgi:hypothetical protein